LCVAQAGALADAPADRAASKKNVRGKQVHYVDGEGGVYDLPVHHDVVTTLYFPDPVAKLFCPHLADFHVDSPMERLVTIRPKREGVLAGNVQVVSGSVKVSLNVSSGARADAVQQVHFLPEARERVFQREVERRTAKHLREEAEKARRAAEHGLMLGMLGRTELRRQAAVERNGQNVIARVTQTLVVGKEAYLFFEIQNRDDETFRVTRVDVLDGVTRLPTRMVLGGHPGDSSFGVESGKRRKGVLAVPVSPGALTVAVVLPTPEGSIRVRGIHVGR